MFLLLSRFIILFVLFLSSVYAIPVSWNMDPDFPDIIHIRDDRSELIEMQMLFGDPWGHKFIEIAGQVYCLPMVGIE